MKVYTVDGSENKVIARTTIGLDADVMTIISSDLLDVKRRKTILLRLHSSNIHLANYLFAYHVKKFCYDIRAVSKIIRAISLALFPLLLHLSNVSGLSSLFSKIGQSFMVHQTYFAQPFTFLLPFVIPIIICTLLYTYAPKLLFRHMPKILFSCGPKIVSILIKYRILSGLQL